MSTILFLEGLSIRGEPWGHLLEYCWTTDLDYSIEILRQEKPV